MASHASPNIATIVRKAPSTEHTSADQLTWLLTFTEAVTQVDPSDFVVSGTTATLVLNPLALDAESCSVQWDATLSGADLAGLNGRVTLSPADFREDLHDECKPGEAPCIWGCLGDGERMTNPGPRGTNDNWFVLSNEPLPSVSLSASPNPVPEGQRVTVTARLSEALSGDVTIPLVLTAVSAETGDYGELASIRISGGSTSGTGRVATAQDDDTDNETFTVSLGSLPSSVRTGSPRSLRVTIVDDDDPPSVSLSASPNPVPEGQRVTVTARLSEALSGDVTIPLVLTAVSAETGDYGELASIRISGGSTSGTGRIATAQDDDTDNETFTVSLGSLPSSVRTGSPQSLRVTIVDDDDPPSVSLSASPNPVPEGQRVTVTARLSEALPGDVTIPLVLTAVSAETGDYGELASIRISGGSTSGTGRVATAQDDDTDNETFTVSLGSLPSSVRTGSPQSVRVTIVDDDDPPSVSLSASPNPVPEGQRVTVTARLSEALPGDVTIPLVLTAVSAETGDYGELASIRISGGSTSGTGRVATAQDDDTDNETFTVSLGSLPSSVRTGSPRSLRVTIVDDDDPPSVSLSASPNPVPEGQRVTVTARLSEALSGDVTIPLVLTAVSAETGDYGELASIRISGGSTSGTGRIATAQDDDTDNETFTVSLGSLPSSVRTGSPQSVRVTIVDDDDPPSVSLSASPNPVPEGQRVTVTARLSEALPGDVTIPLVLTAVSAETGDYGELASIRISGGSTSGTGRVATAQDDDTDNETFTVSLGSLPSSVRTGNPRSLRVTIVDDDTGVGIACKQPVVSVVSGTGRRMQAASATGDDGLANYDVELTLELEEHRDGSAQPVELGCVALAAPDRRFSYTITRGDTTRFAVGATDGALRYVGSGENAAQTTAHILTVTATPDDGGAALHLAVRVVIVATDDGEPARLLRTGLGGFARMVATTAVQVIGQRLTPVGRSAGDYDSMALGVTVNRRTLDLTGAGGAEARGELVAGVADALGIRVQNERVSWEAPSGAEIIAGSAFSAGGRWGVWGSGDLSQFAGDADGFRRDGTVLSGYLGVDYRFVPNALAGLAASYSSFDLASTSEADDKATLTGSLVNVYPYGLWMPEAWLGIWGIAGLGTGASDLTTVDGGIPEESLLSWLGAAGQRAEMWSGDGISLAAKSDGFVTGIRHSSHGALPQVSALAWRARLLLEAGLEARPPNARLSGLVELGARLDGGDAQRGLGAEAGAELRYTHTGIGLGLAGRGRILLVHEDPDVREWGASTALTWEPRDHGSGPSVSVAPSWGRPASGVDALWRDLDAGLASHVSAAPTPGAWLPDAVDVTVSYVLDGLDIEVYGRHLTGGREAGYRFGLGGSLEY